MAVKTTYTWFCSTYKGATPATFNDLESAIDDARLTLEPGSPYRLYITTTLTITEYLCTPYDDKKDK